MKPLILALMLLASLSGSAQSRAWNYVLPLTDLNGVTDVATDDDGNFYTTGRFTGSMQLGGRLLRSSSPGPCFYIAKCSASGELLRLTKLEGATDVLPRSIAVDKAGNTYVTGSFLGTLTYNKGRRFTSRTTDSGSDVFLLKCNAAGTVRWIRQADGNQSGIYGYSSGTGVAVDDAGNSYITGSVSGLDIRFENLSFGRGRYQGFVASYTRLGELRWARVLADAPQSGGISSGGGGGVAVSPAGECYLSGTSGRGWALDGITVPGNLGGNLYLARFDTRQGRLVWAQTVAGQGSGGAIDTDKRGVYLGGNFTGTAGFGCYSLTSAGDADGFVARYTPEGRVEWATAVGGANYEAVNDLAVDQKSRRVTLTGLYNFTPQSTNQAFLASFGHTGKLQQLELVGGPGTSSGGELAIDGKGNIYATGVFTGNCLFGPVGVRNTNTQGYLGRYGSRPVRHDDDDDDARSAPAGIALFPNPAQNQVTLQLTGQEHAGQARLYNPQGRVVAEQALPTAATQTEVVFNTTTLPDGLYMLRLETSEQITTRLINVQH